MAYLIFLSLVCFVVGLLGVSANPSPLFGAAALVLGAGGAGMLLVGAGSSFVGLILFLIYLGGMLVVFAYSVALAAEPYPEGWGGQSVLIYVVGWGLVVLFLGAYLINPLGFDVVDGGGYAGLRGDFSGVALLFVDGGGLLLFSGWGLLLALFVVLELLRGWSRGSLRAV